MKELSVKIQEKKDALPFGNKFVTNVPAVSPPGCVHYMMPSFSISLAHCTVSISVNLVLTLASGLALFLEQFMFTASCFLQGITVTKEIFILATIGCKKNRLVTLSFSLVAAKQVIHSKSIGGRVGQISQRLSHYVGF